MNSIRTHVSAPAATSSMTHGTVHTGSTRTATVRLDLKPRTVRVSLARAA